MSKIYIKSCLNGMNEIETNSIDLIVTSPPYWDLVDYNNCNQLGMGLTFNTYLTYMNTFLLSSSRVLKFDGFLAIIVADIRKNESGSSKERPKLYSIQSYIINRLEGLGIDLHAHIIWKKTSVKSSGKKIIYGSVDKDYAYPPFAYNDLDIEHILIFRKPGSKRDLPSLAERMDKLDKDDLNDEYSSLWRFNEVSNNKNHPATFPNALVERIIKLFSITNDVVLDPFMGSGTTALSCISMNREFLGYEINKSYINEDLHKFIVE